MKSGEEFPLQLRVPESSSALSRVVPELQQNGKAMRWSGVLAAVEQSVKDSRPDWKEHGLLASVDPKDFEEMKRLRAMVDTRLHEALDAEDFEEAIRSALAAGASLAALDHAGRTALHLCVHRRTLGPFKVLLSYTGSVNLGDADGCPVLNVAILHKWIEGARAALAAGADVTAVTTFSKPRPLSPYSSLSAFALSRISQVLQTGASTRYPRVNRLHSRLFYNHTPIHLAVELDELGLLEEMLNERKQAVDCHNAYGETALFTALLKNNFTAVKTLLARGAAVNEDCKLLHMATNHPHILEYILDNTDAIDMYDSNGYALLHKAVVLNCPKSVYYLLKRFNNPMIKQSNGRTALHLAAFHTSNKAAEVLLAYDSSTVNEPDAEGNTALAIAADNGNRTLIMMLLKNGAVLSTKHSKKKTAIELIASRLLDSSNFFELMFDEFIYTDEFNYINVDNRFLTKPGGTSQINVIEEFVRCGQSKMLLHPLIESLLYLKWRHLLPVFCLIIGVNSVFLITFNIFVVHTFYYADKNSCCNRTDFSDKTKSKEGLFEMYDEWYWTLIAMIYGSLGGMLGLELFCIYLKRLRYFGHLESWVKLSALALGAAVAAAPAAAPAHWLRHAACAALLLGWLQAMFLLARFPYWGNYVLMFGKVAVNLLKVLVTAVFLIIGFSFCFMIQYRSKSPFDGPFPAFVKTVVMMSSEFDYEDLFGTEHDSELEERRTVVRLLFMVFVIFMAIVLMNFMIGAAVSDIKDLKVTGNINRLVKQVQLLSILDSLVHGGWFDRVFKKTFSDGRYHKKIRILCGIQVQWFVECATTRLILLYDSEALFQFHSNTYLLPLHKAFVDIATKKKEVRECKCNCFDSKNDAVADGRDKVNRDESCCSGRKDRDVCDMPQPQPKSQTDGAYLHEESLKRACKIEQLTSDMAGVKQITSDMAASLKALTADMAKLKKTIREDSGRKKID